jgi:hypothetical protein
MLMWRERASQRSESRLRPGLSCGIQFSTQLRSKIHANLPPVTACINGVALPDSGLRKTTLLLTLASAAQAGRQCCPERLPSCTAVLLGFGVHRSNPRIQPPRRLLCR